MGFHVQRINTDLQRFEWLSSEPTFIVDGYGAISLETSWTATIASAYDFVTDELASKWSASISDSSVVRVGPPPAINNNPEDDERHSRAADVLIDYLAEKGHSQAQSAKSERDSRRND